MKKTVSFLLFACVGFGSASAQFSAGKKMIGGQISFSTSRADQTPAIPVSSITKSNSFGANLSLSKFTSASRVFGMGIQYQYTDYRYNPGASGTLQEVKNNNTGIYAEVTRLHPIVKKLSLAFTGTAGFLYTSSTNYLNDVRSSDSKGYDININGGMGLWYELSNRFLLTCNVNNLLSVGYYHGRSNAYSANGTVASQGTGSGFNLTTGLNSFSLGNIGFGVRYLLR